MVGSAKDIIKKKSTLTTLHSDMILKGFCNQNFIIYTDGSHNDHTSFLEKIFYGSNKLQQTTTGGLCIIRNQNIQYNEKTILTIHLTNSANLALTSSYPVELLAMLVALHISTLIQPQHICTDCKSIVDLLKSRKKQVKILLKDYSVLIQHLLLITSQAKHEIIHQHSHMDKVKDIQEMTEAEWGNMLADKVASNDIAYISDQCRNHTHHTIDLSQFITLDIIPQLQLYLIEKDSIFLTSLNSKMQERDFAKYTQNRSLTSSLKQHWTTTTYPLATQAWNLDIGTLSQNSSSIRIIFNKLWQPWNSTRYKNKIGDITETDQQNNLLEQTGLECPYCQQLDSLEHLICNCPHQELKNLRFEGIQERRRLKEEADQHPLTLKVYSIIENMLSQSNPLYIYISLWSDIQYQFFINELQSQDANFQHIDNQQIIRIAISNYTRMLACTSQQMVSYRLRIDKLNKKRYGPPTKLQAKYEQRYSNTWINYEQHLNQRQVANKKQKRKQKLTHIQRCINDKKILLVQEKSVKQKQECIYDKPFVNRVPAYQNWQPEAVEAYFPIHESDAAKMENQYRRHLAWRSQYFPKRVIVPFTYTLKQEQEHARRKLGRIRNNNKRWIAIFRKNNPDFIFPPRSGENRSQKEHKHSPSPTAFDYG